MDFFFVGKGTGPTTWAPAARAVRMILLAASSMTRWSKDLSLMRMRGWAVICLQLFKNFNNRTSADGLATFADSKTETFVHRDRGDQIDHDLGIITRHNHLDTLGEL